MIAPGVPDMHSLRIALEMGYECHSDGLWMPKYDLTQFDLFDFPPKAIWPKPIYNQWERLGRKQYRSPNFKTIKEVKI